jgi:hypothetical protein
MKFKVTDMNDWEEKEVRVYADYEEGYVYFKIENDELAFDWDSIEKLGLKLKRIWGKNIHNIKDDERNNR